MSAAVTRPVLVARPSDAVQEARQRFAELEGWILAEDTLSLTFDAVEREQERRGREVMRLLLQAHLDRRGNGDVGAAVELVTCSENGVESSCRLGERRLHGKTIHSLFGEVRAQRRAYYAAKCESVHPLDGQAELPKRTFSYELQRRAVLSSVRGPFDEAVDVVEESTGTRLSKRSVEDLVSDSAADFEDFYAARERPASEETGSILVASVDGKGIPMVKPEQTLRVVRRGKGKKANKKRMATVATVFTQEPRPRTPEQVVESLFYEGPRLKRDSPRRSCGPEHKRVWASVAKSKDEVIADVATEVRARDPNCDKRIVLVIDGERALQQRAARALPTAVEVLDLLHASEKLWKAAYCFHKEGSREAKEWVRERMLRTLQGGVMRVVQGMRQSATKRKLTGKKRKTIDSVTGYFCRNRHRMAYDDYLRQGFPIASGAVEGACKNLVKDRMERAGMRWTIATAEAMLRLRATYLSGDFEDYWRFHVRSEQSRLHPPGRWRVVEK